MTQEKLIQALRYLVESWRDHDVPPDDEGYGRYNAYSSPHQIRRAIGAQMATERKEPT